MHIHIYTHISSSPLLSARPGGPYVRQKAETYLSLSLSLYVYIYIHIYVYLHIYIYIYIYTYVYMCGARTCGRRRPPAGSTVCTWPCFLYCSMSCSLYVITLHVCYSCVCLLIVIFLFRFRFTKPQSDQQLEVRSALGLLATLYDMLL